MADNVIQIVIRARDDAKAQIQSVTTQLNAMGPAGQQAARGFEGVAGALARIPPQAIVAAAAVTAIAGAALAATKALLDAADAGGKFADDTLTAAERAGTTAEAFSRLAYTAEQFDATSGDVSAALRFMNRNLFEAARGGVEAQASFAALGLSFEELSKLDASEAFLRIADRLSRVEDQSARTGIAMRLFGRGAEALNPMLAASRAELEATGARLDQLNGTVSTAAGLLGDEYDNALKDVTAAQKGLQLELAVALLPAMTDLVRLFSGAVVAASSATRALREMVSAVTAIASATTALFGIDAGKAFIEMARAAIVANPVLNETVKLLEIINGFRPKPIDPFVPQEQGPMFKDVRSGADAPLDPLGNEARYEAEKKALEEAEQAAEAYRKRIATLSAEFQKVKAAAFSLPAGLADQLFAIDPEKAAKSVAALNDLFEGAKRVDEVIRGIPALEPLKVDADRLEGLEEIAPRFTEAGEAAAAFNEQLTFAGINVTALREALTAAQTTMDSVLGSAITMGEAINAAFSISFQPLLRGIDDAQRAVFDFVDGAIGALDASLQKFVFEGGKGLRTLGDFFVSLGQLAADLIKQIIVLTIRTAILKALSGPLGGLFGGGGQVQGPVLASAAGGAIEAPAGYGRARRLIPALAAGGALLASGIPALAGGGLGTVPGANSNRDSVLAYLAPGEYVLTNRGGRNPTQVVERLASVGDAFEAAARRGGTAPAVDAPFGGPMIGQVVINAPDWESWRNQARPGGRLADELDRQLELGR